MLGLLGKATALVAVGAMPAPSRTKLEPQPEGQIVEPSTPLRLDSSELDSIGRENEVIRNRCMDIATKIDQFLSVREEVADVFMQVDAQMAELERTKSALIQRNAIFAIERDAHAELKTRFQALHTENEANKSDNELFQIEIERLREIAAAADSRIEALENEAVEAAAQIAVFGVQKQEMEARVTYLTTELQTAQRNVAESDALISSLQSDLSGERDRVALFEQDKASLESALAESQATAARVKTDLDDANIAWDNTLRQLVTSQSEVAKFQDEHARMRSLWQQATDAHASEAAALNAQLEAVKMRAEVGERRLGEARNEMQTKIDELRQEERRAHEALARIATMEQQYQALDGNSKAQSERIAELGESRAKVVRRLKPLVHALREKEAERSRLQSQIESLQARVITESERFNAEREKADAAIKALTENYEREKVLKALAEGALEADRKERVQLQLALKTARDGHGGAAPYAA